MLHDHDSGSRCESTRTSRSRHVHPSVERYETWLRGVRSKYCVADDRKSRTSAVRSILYHHSNDSEANKKTHTHRYDTVAKAVIMTQNSTRNRYDMELRKGSVVESNLKNRLVDFMNTEIALGTVNSKSSAIAWIERTFFYIRAGKNPRQYIFFLFSRTTCSNTTIRSSNSSKQIQHFR